MAACSQRRGPHCRREFHTGPDRRDDGRKDGPGHRPRSWAESGHGPVHHGTVSSTQVPVVIDADGLNILARELELLAELAKRRTIVLTPHPGEMARLAAISTAEVQANRLETARDFARRMGVILVLKGARTLIAHPDGSVAVNTSGNPGMAKGGSGDLLTGIIAGLLAQHPDEPARAVEAAVCLHGLAADLAVRRGDEHTLLATDCVHYLAQAFRYPTFHFGKIASSRYVCLQGTMRVAE